MKKSLLHSIIVFAVSVMFLSCAEFSHISKVAEEEETIRLQERHAAKMIREDSEMLFKAFQTARTIEIPYNKADAYESIAGVYKADGQYDKAVIVAKSIADAKMRAFAVSRISEQAYKDGRQDKATEILSQATDIAKTIDDNHMKSYTLATIGGKYTNLDKRRWLEKYYPRPIA